MQRVTFNVDEEEMSEVVRTNLLQSLQIIEELAQPEDIELWMAMNRVIEYYSTPSQLAEPRTVDINWREMMLETA